MGRHRVSTSPRLRGLPAAGGWLWSPRRWEEPHSEPVGCRGTKWGGEVEARQDQCPWGRGDQERQVGGALPDPRPEEQERRGGCLPHPLKPRKPAGLPGEVPCPLRPRWGARLGPFCSLSLSPTPHIPQGLFQPCGSWALALPTAQTWPLLKPSSPKWRPSPRPFCLFPPPLFYYCDTDVPSSCWFIYIFIFIFFLTYLLVSQSNFIFYFFIVLFFFATPRSLWGCWLTNLGSGRSSCGGSSESKPLA